jgi:hypothetical protein
MTFNFSFAFNKSKIREAPYAAMNCSSFSFFGWLIPFEVVNGQYPGDDKKLIKQKYFDLSLSYFYDCVDNYYRCAINYIKDMYIPYLYRCRYLYYNEDQEILKIKYPEFLQGTSNLICSLHDDKSRVGVFPIFTKINSTHYYLSKEKLFFNILSRSPYLFDIKTDLTNTQYLMADEPNLVISFNGKKVTFNQKTYNNFYLKRGVGWDTADYIRDSVINQRIFEGNKEGISRSLKGIVKLEFYFPFENLSNRFSNLNYNFNIKWKTESSSGNTVNNKLTERNSLIIGPNTVIYLKGIEVRK